MPAKKYQKYVKSHDIEIGSSGFEKIQFVGDRDFESNFSVMYLPVTKPNIMEKFPHSHDFDMYLTFMGLNPNGTRELGGEIVFYLGKEQEEYVFTKPTSFYIPKGFVHCPLNFRRIDSPILLIHATLAGEYIPGKAVEIK